MFWLFFAVLAVCAIALLSSYAFNRKIALQSSGNKEMREMQLHIRKGAWTFMFEEAKVFAIASVVIALVLWLIFYWEVAFAFLLGAFLSMCAGFIGMHSATLSNAKVTNAAQKSLKKAFNIAVSGGAIMGLTVAGLALAGLTLLIFIFQAEFAPETLAIHSKSLPFVSDLIGRDLNFIKAALIVSAYSMGASLVALFDRVGGGIYTKAADMAADLIGKTEAHLPEDDARNPATIADNVGDNVGDVGGLGADLLESFIGSMISIIIIFMYMHVGQQNPDISGVLMETGFLGSNYWAVLLMPLFIAAAGIIATIISLGYILLSKSNKMQKVLMNGMRLSAFITLAIALIIILFVVSEINLFWCILMGAIAGVGIGRVAEYYTSHAYKPVKKIAGEAAVNAGIGIAGGLGVGMLSTFVPALLLAIAVVLCYWFAGLVGIAYGALGMLSFVAMTVSIDTYGPIADNAGGIAQGAGLPKKVRQETDKLDSIGNTTAAVGKGFAIGSAAFSALALIVAYMWSAAGSAGEVVIPTIELLSPDPRIGATVIAALFLGAMVPYVFSALLIDAVSDTARKLAEEIRRQFKKFPGILKGTHKADYKRCISIASKNGLRKMVLPALFAITTPFVIGFLLGKFALAAFLIGSLLSCMQLAVFCANAGGALDNAKKYIEEGHFGGKGSDAHTASVIGDTVGDPLKDTVGPSLDILVKLMSVVSILFASLFPAYPIFL